jgi:hypothetical protein
MIHCNLQGMTMPQIWMTYEELAGMLDCTVTEVREIARLERLDRKISRDGKKRAKLSIAMVGMFIERLKAGEFVMNYAVDDLRRVHDLMREPDDQKSVSPRSLASR